MVWNGANTQAAANDGSRTQRCKAVLLCNQAQAVGCEEDGVLCSFV